MANGHGGKRPGTGRKPGSRTKKTAEIARLANEAGVSPLEVLLSVMRAYYEAGNNQLAADIARHAAPYVHPRLSAVTVGGGATPVQLEIIEELVDVSHAHPATNGQAPPRPAGVPPE